MKHYRVISQEKNEVLSTGWIPHRRLAKFAYWILTRVLKVNTRLDECDKAPSNT